LCQKQTFCAAAKNQRAIGASKMEIVAKSINRLCHSGRRTLPTATMKHSRKKQNANDRERSSRKTRSTITGESKTRRATQVSANRSAASRVRNVP
jgi:hypothetical protein